MSDMRTSLGRVRGLGSAREGTEHFWRQRLTGIANIPLTFYFIWTISSTLGASQSEVKQILSQPFTTIMMLGFVLSVFYHMRLGMQTVIEDYIHDENTKLAALIANTIFVGFLMLCAVFALLKISLSSGVLNV